ncbi:MAG: hypothetical protein Q7R91_00310 [bacterium]|nr:hypothetical protein [bacterium]
MSQATFYKEIIIAVLAVATGIANAYFWKVLIFSGSYSSPTIFSIPAALLFLFAIFFSFLALFGVSRTLGLMAIAIVSVGSFLFITAGTVAFVGIVLSFFGFQWAYSRIRNEAKLSVSFSLSKILRQGLPLFFTAIAVMVSVFYFSSISQEKNQTFLPKAVFELSLPLLQNSLQGIIPGFRPDATIDQLLIGAAQKQTGNAVDISKVPKDQLEKFLQEERAALSKGLGVAVTGKEKAGDLLYNLANQKLEDFVGPYKQYLPYLTAFGFFLAVKALTLPLYFVTLILVWLAVRLLLAVKLLKKEIGMVQTEKVTL